MAPIFRKRSFTFEDGIVPDHVEATSETHGRDLDKFALVGEYVGSDHFYGIATNVDDLESAQALAAAYETHAATAKETGCTSHDLATKVVHILPPLAEA